MHPAAAFPGQERNTPKSPGMVSCSKLLALSTMPSGHGGTLHELVMVQLGALDLLEPGIPSCRSIPASRFPRAPTARAGGRSARRPWRSDAVRGPGARYRSYSKPSIIAARVAQVPNPLASMASRSSSSSTSLPAPSMAESSVASVKRAGGPGLQSLDFHADSLYGFPRVRPAPGWVRRHRQGAPVNFKPAGLDQDLAFAFEVFTGSRGDTGGDQVFRRPDKTPPGTGGQPGRKSGGHPPADSLPAEWWE